MASVAARHTNESALRGPVAPIHTTAIRAGPRSIAGVDQEYWNSHQPRLIFEERTELKERPSVQHGTLKATNRYPLADPALVLERYRARGVFRFDHNLLAEAVIDVFRKTSFSAG